jgi:hypothetical protein
MSPTDFTARSIEPSSRKIPASVSFVTLAAPEPRYF